MAYKTVDYYDHPSLIQQVPSLVAVVIFALASPYKNRLYNVLETCGLTLIACRLCFLENRDIFNVACWVFFSAYFIGFACCKIVLTLNCQGSRKLKAFANKAFGNSVSSLARRVGDTGNCKCLPDRVENPEGYRLLSEIPEERCDPQSTVKKVPTYGIV